MYVYCFHNSYSGEVAHWVRIIHTETTEPQWLVNLMWNILLAATKQSLSIFEETVWIFPEKLVHIKISKK